MDYLRDRRVVLGIGGAFALIAAVGIALGLKAGDDAPVQPPPASKGGLVVQTGEADQTLSDGQMLRCFVGGKFVGAATLADCARRNGVAAGSLDVGIDETGALAAAPTEGGPLITPLPPGAGAGPGSASIAPPPVDPAVAQGPVNACWRHADDWRRLPSDMSLNGCVQALFAGRCERSGSASYGRWGEQTLRLVPGRVEISSDNRSFRLLVEQPAGQCGLPPVS